jgi:NADH-quinone oxidoreductase subunit J
MRPIDERGLSNHTGNHDAAVLKSDFCKSELCASGVSHRRGSPMNIPALFFYLFSIMIIASGFMVISSRNPVHSVLFLILAFFNAAGLFLLLGAEFLAMILVVVYVGAVAVLFLFVVMMLDVDFTEFKQGFLKYLPVGGTIGAIVLLELFVVVGGWTIDATSLANVATPAPPGMSNTLALGRVLYTQYVYLFMAAGLVLLTAMIGAIILTLHHKVGVKRQDVAAQNARTPAAAVELRKKPFREGV